MTRARNASRSSVLDPPVKSDEARPCDVTPGTATPSDMTVPTGQFPETPGRNAATDAVKRLVAAVAASTVR